MKFWISSAVISKAVYIDFYDFAPVGYLTLNDQGLISEINLTCAELLGMDRRKLLRQRLAHFVTPEDNDRYHQHLLNVLKHDKKLTCELAFKRSDGAGFAAQLDCLRLIKDGRRP